MVGLRLYIVDVWDFFSLWIFCHLFSWPCVPAVHGNNPNESRLVFVRFCLGTEQLAHLLYSHINRAIKIVAKMHISTK